ncbi:MAG: G8 domain-containing protein [Bacteroidota bacterium]
MRPSLLISTAVYCWALFILPAALSAQLSNWSSPDSWPNGAVPRAGEAVQIPPEAQILLDISPPELGTLEIQGELTFADSDLRLTAKSILVRGGLLQIGTSDLPFEQEAIITLSGQEEDFPGLGARHLVVMEGGRLALHAMAANKRSWTQIAEGLSTGSRQMQLSDDPVNWQVGDEIVLAPSGYDPYEAERLTITGITGRIINFTPALAFDHFGELQSFTTGDGTTRQLDERAEVGMLSRNVIIQGAANSADLHLGGHIMILDGAGPIHLSGVALRRMGQPGQEGRYSCHWHFAGDRSGDYVENCSIYDGLQRGIVAHGTNNLRVVNNVAYNIQNHIFIPAEDGNETGNLFMHNLAILARRVDEGFFAFPQEGRETSFSFQAEHRPSGFWMRNLHNPLIGNRVAGAERGVGFFFDVIGRHRDFRHFDALPDPMVFHDNVAHSISVPGVNNNAGSNVAMYARVGHGFGLFVDKFNNEDTELIFDGFTAYKCDMSGIWNESENVTFTDLTLADNTSAFISGSAKVEDALVVGRSANALGGRNRVLRHGHHRAGFYTVAQGGKKRPQMRNISFVNMHDDTDNEAAAFVLDYKLEVKPNYVENIHLENSRPLWMETSGAPGRSPSGACLFDRDGSLTGRGEPVTVVWPNSPLVRPDCDFVEAWNAFICPADRFMDFKFHSPNERVSIDLEQQDGEINYDRGLNTRELRVRVQEDFRLVYDPEIGPQDYLDIGMAAFGISNGDHSILHIPYPFGGARMVDENGNTIPRVSSENAVRNADQTAYYLDRQRGWIVLKAVVHSTTMVWYHLEPGEQVVVGEEEVNEVGSVNRLGALQLRPNPVIEEARLFYELFATAEVNVQLVDILGREVASLFTGLRSAGNHELPINIPDLQRGVYHLRVQVGEQIASLPLVKQ